MNQPTTSRSWRAHGWAALLLFAGALGLYWTTLSRGAFPGLPAKSLSWHLWLDAAPTLLDSLWGRLVRLSVHLPGGTVAFRMGVLSALLGAGGVALVSLLMMRVRYPLHDKHDPDEIQRERQGRLLAGATAGLFAALNIPFWIQATRSLPGTFHVFLLLSAAWLLSEYQRNGRPLNLYALGLLYGVGISEFHTFLVFAPLAALLVVRAMLQRAAFRWPVLIRTGLCLIPGLLMYVWNGWTLWSEPAVRLRGFGSMWTVVWYIWRDQWHLIVHGPQTAGFLLVILLTVGPWSVLYLLRPKKPPWRFTVWQVLLRLLVLLVSVGALFNAPGSPWRYFGMHYLMVTPYLILAACAGHVAGEFWVMGQLREHRNAGIGQPLRSTMGVLALLLPLAALAAGAWNLPVADGRPGARIEAWAAEALDACEGREVIISGGVLDDSLRLLAREHDRNAVVITAPHTGSRIYRDYLALWFTQPREQALLQVGFDAFMQDFLATDENLERVAAIDLADALREFGYLLPDRLAYRVVPEVERVDIARLVESQQPFWARLEASAQDPIHERNLAHPYEEYVRRVASKVANNLGFSLVERGDVAGAEALFHQARRLDPENISALLNLMSLDLGEDRPGMDEYRAEWEAFKSRQVDSRVMWSLSGLYGYVHNTAYLARHGLMWAISGRPRMAEAELRRAMGGRVADPQVKAFLARAFLHGGDIERGEAYYRELLEANPGDITALVMLLQLAIRSEDLSEAERLFAQAEALGVEPHFLAFEQAMLAYVQGRPEDAIERLQQLVGAQRDNFRAWAMLAVLTNDGRHPELHEQAVRALRTMSATAPDVRLLLAELLMGRREWAAARAEIDQVIRMNPRLVRAWELLVQIDYRERKKELAEDHVRILLTLDPRNFIGNLMLGSFQYARGQHSLAESSYRAAVAARRDPIALNDLAYLLLVRGGSLEEAGELIEEALALQPDLPLLLSTRSEIHLAEGRLDEAERDLRRVLAAMPNQADKLLLVARLYAARGQRAEALNVAEPLLERQDELSPEHQARLQGLLQELR